MVFQLKDKVTDFSVFCFGDKCDLGEDHICENNKYELKMNQPWQMPVIGLFNYLFNINTLS